MPRLTLTTDLCGCCHFGLEHFVLNLLNRADAEANCLCHFVDTDPLSKLGSCLAQLLWIGARPAEALFDFAMFRDEMALALDFVLGALEAALTRVRIIERSNSANAPVIWNMSLPAGVVVSMFC